MVAALLLVPLAPLIAGIALICGDRWPRPVSRHTSYLVAFGAMIASGLGLALVFWKAPVLDVAWVPAIGMRLHLGVDGISKSLLVLTAAIGVLVIQHARHDQPDGGNPASYFGCVLLVVGGALATFMALDAVSFFLAFELVLVPMWLLIHRFGDPHQPEERARAATVFVLYTVLGSTLMLIGILALVFTAGTSDLTAMGHATQRLSAWHQSIIAVTLLIGLGIKVPMWPLHSWLPRAHTAAPTGGSMLLAAVLLKMGTYGVVRLVIAPLPAGVTRLAPYVATLAVVGILWGGLMCLVETGLKKLVAWSSVAHMGFVMLALMSGTVVGVQAALFGNIAHGVISALLFVVVGGLKQRWGADNLDEARHALRDVSPRLGFALVVGFAASLGLPGLAGFWGEILAITATWSPAESRPVLYFRVLASAAALGSVLAAAYSLRVLRKVWAGGTNRADHEPPLTQTAGSDAHGLEWSVVSALTAAVVVIGLLPISVLNLSILTVQSMTGLVP